MFTPINPEREQIRAEAILRSFTEYNEAVKLFAPTSSQEEQNCDQVEAAELAANGNRKNGQAIIRIFRALSLNRWPSVDKSIQEPAYSPRQVTTSGCSQ